MEYCHGLRAGGLHLWQDEIQKANCRFDRIEQESDKKLLLSSELKHSVKYEIDAQPRRGRPRSYPTDKSWTGSFEDGDAKEWFKTSPAR